MYQYFEDIEDSFFTLMEIQVIGIHDIFVETLRKEKGDLFSALAYMVRS